VTGRLLGVAWSGSRRRAAILVCLAAILPYVVTLNDYFVRDDFGVVQLLGAKPWNEWPRWFVTSWMDDIWGFNPDEIRPFPAVSYQLTALGGAASPWLHHAFNVALHAANGVLVLALAIEVAGLSIEAALFGATVFVLLPVNVESVAWITGRVDSMPAFFYTAALLAYARWRVSARQGWYLGALALFFVALFTKQTAITMIATIVAYDALFGRLRGRFAVLPYVPFVAMTAGYLELRHRLFGEFVRESGLGWDRLIEFVRMTNRHLAHVVVGRVGDGSTAATIAMATILAVWVAGRYSTERRRLRASVLFFGPVWWGIGVAPTLMAGYESPRHVYLAAMGWAVVLGVAFHLLWSVAERPGSRRIARVAAGAVLTLYLARLGQVVWESHVAAAVSEKAVADVRAEALAAPPGTLLIVAAPVRSWEWSLPFALRPPYVAEDLTRRVHVISPNWLHCCRPQWFQYTQDMLRDWSALRGETSIVVLRWDEDSGALSRVSDREEPALRGTVPVLRALDSSDTLDAAVRRTVAYLVPAPGRSP
jgi:hypothetical protein